MIRHYIIAALRNLAAQRLLSALAILGLSLGVTATLMAALTVEGLWNYYHFIPGYQQVAMVIMPDVATGRRYTQNIDPRAGGLLTLAIPQLEAVARKAPGGGEFRNGNVSAAQSFFWVDPTFFKVMPLPIAQGDGATALARPDSVVITPATARKYFGRDDVVGQTLLLNDRPLIVTAVLRPLPMQTWSRGNPIFVSGSSAGSPFFGAPLKVGAETYLRLKPQADLREVQRLSHVALASLLAELPAAHRGATADAPLVLPVDHLFLNTQVNADIVEGAAVIVAFAILLLLLASVNCVNLMVARAGRRVTEVMMRKVCGAGRRMLMLQFLSEATLTVLLAVILGVALTEWAMKIIPPSPQAAALDLWHDPFQAPALAVYVVLLGVAVGAWPAFVLSSFRPAQLARSFEGRRTGLARKALVVLQFAAVIMMLIAALVIDSQWRFALARPLGVNVANVLTVQDGCRPAFLSELRKLPDVVRASCSEDRLDGGDMLSVPYKGEQLHLARVRSGGDTMAVYGVVPLAGAALPDAPSSGGLAPPVLAINRAAALRLGFAAPERAIGAVPFAAGPLAGKRIVAVMPDFTLSVERPAEPTVFLPEAADHGTAHVKIGQARQDAVLADIDHAWHATGGKPGPVPREFVQETLQRQYIGLETETEALGASAVLAVFLACLGLTGLTVAAAERRIKEIGIRKAMGASTTQVTALLLEHFLRPVIWASLVAWPLAGWLMWQWLSGFAYHITLPLWAFAAASLIALVIALLTVAWQAWLAARQKPVLALRYE